MAKFWDDMLKRMFTAYPQHFLTWLAPDAVLLHEPSTELKTQTISELKARQPQETRDHMADILYVILWYGVLLARFKMYEKDLEDSLIYLEILREGREQGRIASLRETIIQLIENRYPTLANLAAEQVRLVQNPSILQQTVIKLFASQTAGEIEECLLALHDDAAKN